MASKLAPEDQLIKARWGAARAAPYLARAIWACTWLPTPEVPTAGIDRNFRVYYNPNYIEKCHAEGTLIGEVLHEVLHPLKRNPSREDALAKSLGHCNHSLFNACTDCENDFNIESMRSVKLVSERVTFKALGAQPGEVAEEMYRRLKDKAKGDQKEGRCSGGSGTGGKAMPWEKSAAQKADAVGKTGLAESQVGLLQAQVAQDILKHESKARGSVPAGMLRWAKEIIQGPPIPWEELVASKIAYVVDKKRGTVASFDRPSRRLSTFILPVYRSPHPKITIVGDTSGSMGERDLGKVLGVVGDACLALGKVSVVACGAASQDPVEVSSLPELEEFFKGGGGTDMPAGIRAAEELTQADAIVVVTDGYTDWPREETSTPVTAVVTQPGGRRGIPGWIEVVEAFDGGSHGEVEED